MLSTIGDILMIILALLLILSVTLIIYGRWHHGSLEAMGVPVVKPHWILGSNYNYMQLYHHWEDLARSKRLGPIYGVYEGRTPIVVVTDPELIYRISFSESEHFEKRAQDFGNPVFNENIEFQNGEKWKTIHNMLSPQFTSGKIKTQSEIIVRISKEYVEFLQSKMDSSGRVCRVDLHELFAPFMIQVIAEMLCGIKINDPRDPNNSFVKNMRTSLFDGMRFDWTFNVIQVFPFLLSLLPSFRPDHFKFLIDNVADILDKREESGQKVSDMVGVLLEMRLKARTDSKFKQLGIGVDSVFAQALEFFSASYLGVITTLKELCYFLVMEPQIYSKVLTEVDSVLDKFGGDISHESVAEMDYLEACITETLRIAPAFFRLERTCVKDWSSGDGIRLKAGTHVAFSMYATHHNPQFFENPKKFLPERFLAENKDNLVKCSFLAFGHGQRQCLGRRLVYPLMKTFMANILNEFRLEKMKDTKWVENPGSHVMVILDPIFIDFVKRSN